MIRKLNNTVKKRTPSTKYTYRSAHGSLFVMSAMDCRSSIDVLISREGNRQAKVAHTLVLKLLENA